MLIMTDITDEVTKSHLEEQFSFKNELFTKFYSKLSDVNTLNLII